MYNCEFPGNSTHLLATRGLKWWRHLEEWSPNGRSEVSNQPDIVRVVWLMNPSDSSALLEWAQIGVRLSLIAKQQELMELTKKKAGSGYPFQTVISLDISNIRFLFGFLPCGFLFLVVVSPSRCILVGSPEVRDVWSLCFRLGTDSGSLRSFFQSWPQVLAWSLCGTPNKLKGVAHQKPTTHKFCLNGVGTRNQQLDHLNLPLAPKLLPKTMENSAFSSYFAQELRETGNKAPLLELGVVGLMPSAGEHQASEGNVLHVPAVGCVKNLYTNYGRAKLESNYSK